MKVLAAVMVILLFNGVPSDKEVKPGLYTTIRPPFIEHAWLYYMRGIRHFSIGSELRINVNSTFLYTTCGNIISGTWTASRDSLFLHAKTNRWRNDSLNQHGFNGEWPKVPDKPIGFKIVNSGLEAIERLPDGTKLLKKLNILKDP
jgi:hypothetical protein